MSTRVVNMDALVRIGSEYLEHYGVRGMKWGVRKKRDGSGVVKVKYRPTYTTEERRQAKAAVKTAKKSGTMAVDQSGADLRRVAQLNTPIRRAVNATLGTTMANLTTIAAAAATLTGIDAAIDSAGSNPSLGDQHQAANQILMVTAAGMGTVAASRLLPAYKVFFKNAVKNPTVRMKVDLSPSEMARYSAGETLTKSILSKNGSAKLSVSTGKSTVSVEDKEGRDLGGQSRVSKPTKTS